MARPLIMASVVLVYLAGLLIARARGHAVEAGTAAGAFAALLLVSLSIHYTNEYADHETDALTRPTRYSGGSGVLPSGQVPRRLALQAAWITLLGGLGLALIGWGAGWLAEAALLILIIGAFFGWMYSLPPLKLAWRGWGELDNALLGGLALPLYGYSAVTGRVDWEAALVCLPFTLLVFNNLLATTWADRHADAQVGKFTLATFVPVRRLRWLYLGVVALAFALLLSLPRMTLPPAVLWLSLPALPMLAWGAFTYTRQHTPYPTSNAMVLLLLGQMAGWWWAG
ncbi:MAG: prenyltransferase [Anaerolineae bacterium]|nr:prenyltransferase [Anaerolineae bacterium]